MHFSRLIFISAILLIKSIEARELTTREHVQTFLRDSPGQPIYEGIVEKRPIRQIFQDVHNRISKTPIKEHLSTFSKNLQDMLSRLVPNRNLVEDLMGYVSSSKPKLVVRN